MLLNCEIYFLNLKKGFIMDYLNQLFDNQSIIITDENGFILEDELCSQVEDGE